jgi:hypothetical protein
VPRLKAEVELDPTGRLRLVAVSVDSDPDGYIDVALWRSVPIARIETVLNHPRSYQSMFDNIDNPPQEGTRVTEWNDLDGQYESTRKARLRLRTPKGPKYPDDFYDDVADAYYRLALEGRAPAQVLAETNKVPKTTVVRWIREARHRGLLAPAGGKGRIG